MSLEINFISGLNGGDGSRQDDSGMQGMYDLQHALENDINKQQAFGAVGGLVGPHTP